MPAQEFSYGREAGRTYMAALEDGVSRGTTTHGNLEFSYGHEVRQGHMSALDFSVVAMKQDE